MEVAIGIIAIFVLICWLSSFWDTIAAEPRKPEPKRRPQYKEPDKWGRKATCGGTHSWIVDGDIDPSYIRHIEKLYEEQQTRADSRGILDIEDEKPY